MDPMGKGLVGCKLLEEVFIETDLYTSEKRKSPNSFVVRRKVARFFSGGLR